MNLKKWIGVGVIALLAIIGLSLVGVERIDAGHVGIKVNMTGGDKGIAKTEYVTGWVFYTKGMSKIYEFPTFQQHKEYEAFTVPSKGGTIFTIHPSFNYALVPGEVGTMFGELRKSLPELENGYILNSVRIALRETTNRFTVDSILNNVSVYDAAVTDVLNEELKPYFIVSQFTSNLQPDESLKQTLAAKALSIQQSLQLKNEQEKIKAQAENDIIEAKRDSTVKVVNAAGEARSIALVQQALQSSPQYVELKKAEKWDGQLPQYVLGSTGMFMNIGKP